MIDEDLAQAGCRLIGGVGFLGDRGGRWKVHLCNMPVLKTTGWYGSSVLPVIEKIYIKSDQG